MENKVSIKLSHQEPPANSSRAWFPFFKKMFKVLPPSELEVRQSFHNEEEFKIKYQNFKNHSFRDIGQASFDFITSLVTSIRLKQNAQDNAPIPLETARCLIKDLTPHYVAEAFKAVLSISSPELTQDFITFPHLRDNIDFKSSILFDLAVFPQNIQKSLEVMSVLAKNPLQRQFLDDEKTGEYLLNLCFSHHRQDMAEVLMDNHLNYQGCFQPKTVEKTASILQVFPPEDIDVNERVKSFVEAYLLKNKMENELERKSEAKIKPKKI